MMKTFILIFGVIFLSLLSSCAPTTIGTTASPKKIAFVKDPRNTESVNVALGKAVYVQIEQPSGFFDLNERQLKQLDERLSDIDIKVNKNDILVTGVSLWFTLVDYQLFYNTGNELVLIDDEDWSIELKKTIARREIERVKKERAGDSDISHIRYSEWFDFVFAITPDDQAGGEYFVAANIKIQGGNTGEVVLRFKAPSNRTPPNTPKENSSGLAS